jgi:uncharacterized membrane protein
MSNTTLNWDIEEHRHSRAITTNILFALLIVNYVVAVYFFDIEGAQANWFAAGFGTGIAHFFLQGREVNLYSLLFQSLSKFKISIISKE